MIVHGFCSLKCALCQELLKGWLFLSVLKVNVLQNECLFTTKWTNIQREYFNDKR